MTKFSERIRSLRKEKAFSQQELANQLGLSKSSVNMYERGEREPNLETLELIADYFNVDMEYLLGKSDHRSKFAWLSMVASGDATDIEVPNIFHISTKRFPVLGNIACGEPILADEHIELYIEAGTNIQADFVLRAKGDSMIGARIQDGDFVFIRQQDAVVDGEIAAVLIDDEATLKRVYYDKEAGVLTLCAENPAYKIMRYSGEDLDRIRILGKAIAFQSDIR